MTKILGSLPANPVIAVSGGPDSMFALDFISMTRPVTVITFDHNTGKLDKALEVITKYIESRSHRSIYFSESSASVVSNDSVYSTKRERDPGESIQAYWREQRYNECFFKLNESVITAHNLDDCVENWFLTAVRGNPKVIPYRNRNVIRPFLLWPKETMRRWCKNKTIPFIDDPSNEDLTHPRARMRHEIIPSLKKINLGLETTISKIVEREFSNEI